MGISAVSVTGRRDCDGTRTGRWVLLGMLGATATVWAAGFALVQLVRVRNGDPGYVDLLVYRAGGRAVLAGHSLYAADFGAVNGSPNGLPFTYPPFSALIFVPLALLPASCARVSIVVLNGAACMILLGMLVAASQKSWDRLRGWRRLIAPMSVRTARVVTAAAVIFMLSAPVQGNFSYGQIDVILAAAVALDILLPSTPWPRGLLVGLATAVKLTPAVFVGYFLVTRQWRALAVSVAAVASAVALGWLVAPSDTLRYFTSTAFHPARIGGLAFAANQSLLGVIARIPALDAARGVIFAAATVVVVALAIAAIEVGRRVGEPVAAMLSAAFIGLLCSPVSWSHHWVWFSATAVYFLVRWSAVGGVRNAVPGLAVAVLTLVPPWMMLPNSHERERLWNWFEHLAGSIWALTALLLLTGFATARLSHGDHSSPADHDRSSQAARTGPDTAE